MKTIKNVCLIAFLAVGLFLLTACGKKEGIVGKWAYEAGGYTYKFNEDGTGEYNGAKFTYTIDGDKISILYEGNTAPFETTFSIDGDKLDVKDVSGNSTIYNRK